MLCESCYQREATVHLTLCTSGEDSVAHRDFCEICVPFNCMTNEERNAAIRKLLVLPPDLPMVGPEGSPNTI
jgi:protein-arginine kinase activator protein McsA